MLLTLPVPQNCDWKLFFVSKQVSFSAIKLVFEYNSSTTIGDLKSQIKQSLKKTENLVFKLLDSNIFNIVSVLDENDLISKVRFESDSSELFCF
jgi:hypothetical protein